jgi:xylulose-5-phosphate/fructose-6-phosphate phosphoketolase
LVHQSLAGTLDGVLLTIRHIQSSARASTKKERLERPRWPMIVFSHAQGLDRTEIRRWQTG